MFTGIVRGLFKVVEVQKKSGLTRYAVRLNDELLSGLQVGTSVAIDGVCQTITHIDRALVWFEAIQETLDRTTLDLLDVGRTVNVELSARMGDEIGGHLLSGHIVGKAQISKVLRTENNHVLQVCCPPSWMKYFFSKGFIALDGASLTLVEVDPRGEFSVHLISETLKRTTFGFKKEGDLLNVELDSRTQIIVETIERLIDKNGSRVI